MVRQLAQYVMRGRLQAILAAVLFSFIPGLGWVGVAIMGLVTLQKGLREGLFLLLWVALPDVVFAIVEKTPMLLLYDFLIGSCVVYFLAFVLRRTGSWAFVLQVGALLGIVGVLIAHAAVNHIDQWWFIQLNDFMQQVNTKLGMDLNADVLKTWAIWMSKIATGTQAVIFLLVDLVVLLFARWLQTLLYSEGELKRELYRIRLNWVDVGVLLLVLLAIFSQASVVFDILPVILAPFFLAGLSLVHCVVATSKTVWAWLSGFYCLLVLFFPYMMVLLVLASVADSCLNLREKLKLT